jgi:hypothetical protein
VQLPGSRGFGLALAWLSPDLESPRRAINSPASFPRATNLDQPVSSRRRGDVEFAPAGPAGLVERLALYARFARGRLGAHRVGSDALDFHS